MSRPRDPKRPERAAIGQETRIEDLETRAAYQEQTIDEMSEMIAAQWKEIDALNRKLARLEAKLEAAIETLRQPDQPEPPPPHY